MTSAADIRLVLQPLVRGLLIRAALLHACCLNQETMRICILKRQLLLESL